MATVFPFRPYRYSETAGPLQALVTQPYDKITPEMQARYLSLSPYNLVRIILGERLPSDTESDNVYTRAAAYLRKWIADGILFQEPTPCLFAYFQEFSVPDTGERLLRKGFIGLGKVEDYSTGVVYRHEQTLSGPKKDRMELLQHTRAHFGQIFMLYPDRQGTVDAILDSVSRHTPCCEVTDEYSVVHRLWKISDRERITAITTAMADKKLIIADGHHRYETALAFHNDHPELEDASKVMMTFVNMYSPGLKILATHRVVDGVQTDTFFASLRERFPVRELSSVEALKSLWGRPEPQKVRIGVAVRGRLAVLEIPREGQVLDVSFLHERILRDMLNISDEAIRNEQRVRYVRGVELAIQQTYGAAGRLAFLLEPTSVEDVARIAFACGLLPQKSTDFYPKLLSGLTVYVLEK